MWESHLAHNTSVRVSDRLLSTSSCTFSLAMGCQKLGQPVPESNFAAELKSGNSQATHSKMPCSWISLRGLENGASVPFSSVTLYWSGFRIRFHSSLVLVTFLTPCAFRELFFFVLSSTDP